MIVRKLLVPVAALAVVSGLAFVVYYAFVQLKQML
jgi:hypothetical protein